MRLKDKVALITGAGSGIGRASAILFAKEGAKVVVVDLDSSGGNKTIEQIQQFGGEALFIQGDVSNPSDSKRMVKTTISKFGKIYRSI